jgi:hypothetical protein
MTQTKEELQEQITTLKERIATLEQCDNIAEYNEMLDEVYGEVKIGELTYMTSDVLSSVDPIAYRCGHSDYNDYLLTDAQDELKALETELKELEEEATA